jgi:hypothetical protein
MTVKISENVNLPLIFLSNRQPLKPSEEMMSISITDQPSSRVSCTPIRLALIKTKPLALILNSWLFTKLLVSMILMEFWDLLSTQMPKEET